MKIIIIGVLLALVLTSDSLAAQRSPRTEYQVESGSPNADGDETCRGRCTRLEQECATGCRDTYSENYPGCTASAKSLLKRAQRGNAVNSEHANRAIQMQGECMDNESDAYIACTDDCREGGWQCRDSCPD